MALLYAFRDATGTWHGNPHARIDWTEPAEARLTVIDERSPFAGQTVTVRSAAIEGIPGSYITLDHGYRLCMTAEVERILFPWTTDRPATNNDHPGIVEPQRGTTAWPPDDGE